MPTKRQTGQTRRRWLVATVAFAGVGFSVNASSEPAVQPTPKQRDSATASTPAPATSAPAAASVIDLTDIITSVVLIRVKTDLGNGTVSISEGTGVYLGSGKVLTASHVVSSYTTIDVIFLPPPQPLTTNAAASPASNPTSKPTTPPTAPTSQTTSPLKLIAGSSQVVELPPPSATSPPSNPSTTSTTSTSTIVTVAFDPTKGKLLSYPTADVSLLTNIAAPAWAKPAKIAPRKVALNDATVSVGVQRDLVRRLRTGVVVDTTSGPHTFHATSASQKGDSGGPTFNAKGEVVGILSGVMTAQWKRPDGSTFERTTSVSFNVAGMTF